MKIVIQVYDVTGLVVTSDEKEVTEDQMEQWDSVLEEMRDMTRFYVLVGGKKRHYNPKNIVSIWWEEVK